MEDKAGVHSFLFHCLFPLGGLRTPDGGKLASSAVPVSAGVVDLTVSGGVDGIEWSVEEQYSDIPLFCYTPAGFNTWIGDIALCSFRGVFHIFYLHDRHHHTSRKGRGAHMFCHLTSTNLIDWTDHGEVVTFDKPYLTVGTGNAFVLDDRLYLAFGWHTERSKPDEQCAASMLKQRFDETGRVDAVGYDELGDIYPSGASCAVSENGVDFTYSNKIIHYVENPNISVMPDGTLRLCEYGIWKGETLDHWHLTDPGFPPRLRNSQSLNTTECPCFFTLDGREYLMIGFTGFYRMEPGGALKDLVSENLDFYDGMAVPMAAKHNDRIIAGAWMNTPEWGSFMMLRELVALDNGGVGSRWVGETLPAGEFVPLASGDIFTVPENAVNTKLQFELSGYTEIRFSGTGNDCIFVFDPQKQLVAWCSSPDGKVEFFSDIVRRRSDAESFRDLAGEPIHVWGENYARKVDLPENSFSLKIILHNEPKFHGAVIDMEIAGKYTFATYRRDLKKIKSVSCK